MRKLNYMPTKSELKMTETVGEMLAHQVRRIFGGKKGENSIGWKNQFR